MLGVVFTGDLIGSTKVDHSFVDASMNSIAKACKTIETWQNHPCYFTRFRGDGWQIYINNNKLAIRALVIILASLRANPACLGTRIALGFGEVNIHSDALSDATGSALIASGRKLEKMGSHKLAAENAPAGIAPVLPLLSHIANGWSVEQAQATHLAIQIPSSTQISMAEQLGISQPALNARLQDAGYPAFKDMLDCLEA